MSEEENTASSKTKDRLFTALKFLMVGLAFWLIAQKVTWNDVVTLLSGETVVGRVQSGFDNDSTEIVIETSDGTERTIAKEEMEKGRPELGVVTAATQFLSIKGYVLGMLMIFCMHLISVYRWRLLLSAHEIFATYGRCFRLTFMGFFWNNIMPGMTGGDVPKAYLIAKDHPQKRSEAVSTVIVDRLVGLFALACLSTLAILLNLEKFKEAGKLVFVVLAGCVAVALCILSKRIRRWLHLDQIMRKLPGSKILMKLDSAFQHYRTAPGLLGVAFVISFVAHVFNILAVVVFGKDLGIETPWLTYFATVPLIYITASVPIFPGGWGVRETAFLVAFAAVGVDERYESRVLLLSLLLGFSFMLWSLLGGVFLFGSPKREREAMQNSEEALDT